MKKILIGFFSLSVFAACKKDAPTPIPPIDDPIPGTLSRSAALQNQTIETPASSVLVGQFVYHGGSADTVLQVHLRVASAGIPFSKMNNLRVVIRYEAGDSALLTSSTVLPEGNWADLVFFPKNKRVDISVYLSFPVEIAGGSIVPALALRDYYYSGPHMAYVAGQETVFSTTKLTTKLSAATPPTARLSGETVETLAIEALSNAPATITTVGVKILEPAAVQRAEVYEGATLLGMADVSGVTTEVPISVPVEAGVLRTFTVKLRLQQITGALSGTNVRTAAFVGYTSTSGIVRTNDTLRTGSDIIVHKAVPQIAVQQIAGQLVNGAPTEVFRIALTAPQWGSVALKQLALPLVWADNQSNDTLRLKAPLVSFGGSDVTALCRISKNGGDTVSVFTEGMTVIYLTATQSPGELVIPAGETKYLTLTVTPEGFDAAEADGFSLALASDAVSTSYRYLNAGSGGFTAKLFSSSAPPSNAAQLFNCIWSDLSAQSHSAVPGISSADWWNGYLLYSDQPTQIFVRH